MKSKVVNEIEVELRGPLSKSKLAQVEKILEGKGEFQESKDRLFIDYSTFIFGEELDYRKKDIRLRVTNGVPEIVVKFGRWGGKEARKEISVLANNGEFDKLVQIFAAVGLTKGMLGVRKSRVYKYRGIEFSLVEVSGHSYYFEAEKLVSKNEDGKETEKEIGEVCKGLGLTLFSHKDFLAYVGRLNREVNEIFDFKDYRPGYFKRRFQI